MEATIIRSRRRTIALEIKDDASLVVRAPKRVPHEYILEIIEQKRSWIEKKRSQARQRKSIPLTKVQIKHYKQKAIEIIPQRVRSYTLSFDLKYNKIKINNAQKRLGSCSARGNLNFSWRIILSPLPVIDYVICHELAHLIEKNHSSRFWKKVGELNPDYKECKKWLKENGYVKINIL